MLLLHTTEKSGTVFLRTDQLDGETDWKLRKSLNHIVVSSDNSSYDPTDYIEKPDSFVISDGIEWGNE